MNCRIEKLNKADPRILNESYRRYQRKYISVDYKKWIYILNFFYVYTITENFQKQKYVA
jgi:hypothetical protein